MQRRKANQCEQVRITPYVSGLARLNTGKKTISPGAGYVSAMTPPTALPAGETMIREKLQRACVFIFIMKVVYHNFCGCMYSKSCHSAPKIIGGFFATRPAKKPVPDLFSCRVKLQDTSAPHRHDFLSNPAQSTSTKVSQPHLSATLPSTMPKKTSWMALVTGPRLPAPTGMRSIVRMGVISAAVPVKKTSSAR